MPNNAILDRLEAWQAQMITFLEAQKPQVVGLPRHRLGIHWISDQYRQSDLDYMAALRPPVIKIVNPSRDRVAEAFARVDANGHVALRYHPPSEQQAELAQNPAGLGVSHAQYWIQQLSTTYKEFDRSRLYVMGINEPSVHNAAEATRVAVYTENFLRTLQPHGIRAYVFNFSVGWPREEAGRIIWDEFLHLEDLINATNSFGCVHEYGYPHLVNSGWGSYGNRISRCPMKIKFVIGECGYTRQLAGLPQPWGWDGNITAPTYAQMLWDYADKVDPGKVFAVLPFTTSFGGEEWRNKDTAKAHADILGRKHNFAWPNPWPQYTTPPIDPPTEADPMLIIVPRYTGRITGYYGSLYTNAAGAKYSHEGLDVSMPEGTPIYAPWDGTVKWSDFEQDTYGNYIRVGGAYRADFFYGHLKERLVQTGNSVKQGQLIGRSGNTGNSTGPHLHFEIRLKQPNDQYAVGVSAKSNGRVDPLAWLAGWQAMGGKVEER